MKRLLFIALLLTSVFATGQNRYPLSSSAHLTTVGGVDSANWIPAFKDYYYAIDEAGRPAIDTADFFAKALFSLDSAGLWGGRMSFFFPLCQKTPQGALLDMVNPDSTATAVSSPVHTPYRGYDGGGSGYINTNRNLSTEAPNFTQDDATIGVYNRESGHSGFLMEIGVKDGSANETTIMVDQGGNQAGRVNTSSTMSGASASSAGLHMITRRLSNESEGYENGSSIATAVAASTGVPDAEIYLLAYNNNGAPGFQSSNEVALAFALDAISNGEAATIYAILQLLMTKLGAQV